MTRTVALHTLGCKVNQYESSYLLETLRQAGYGAVSFREAADLYVVHSCAVTGKAALETRQLLRRAQRLNPGATIVVAGCDAQIEADRLAEQKLATHILGSMEKFDLPRWLEVDGSLARPCRAVSDSRRYSAFRTLPVTRMAAGRTRAFLKIQDGCDGFCSYCIVPYSRGRSRSLALPEVLDQMARFRRCGYREMVLSGIHLGQWGKDLQPALGLVDLLKALEQEPNLDRLRFSSLETLEWSAELLQRLPSWSTVCHHFHIPLQSGDGEILKRMGRPYTVRQFAELIQALHALFPHAALGTDILVGFPGETEHHFRHTLELVQRLPLSYLHVFPYSPRPGTAAEKWPGRAVGDELKRRTQVLRNLGMEKRFNFQQTFLGQTVEVLVEEPIAGQPGRHHGMSHNYLRVNFSAPQTVAPGSLVHVKLTRIEKAGLGGELNTIPG
jgi:threonylcarbamoyladenosine tRNA methylthiotransferase MtaB